MSDLVICKLRISMVIHDTECPYWDQTTQTKANLISFVWSRQYICNLDNDHFGIAISMQKEVGQMRFTEQC